ncbi:hypothetical protein RMATCC62417_04517 [Rhizopus microsporus]|nr:hypothetical protein RMATCC62417_04517 [Rhizopus microsporus]
MADSFCSSISEIVTQRIIQSSGFESATNQSIHVLSDVLRQYLELLGSYVSAYANLNGRTIGNAWDLIDAMEDLYITPDSLKEWLDKEGKQLSPCWAAQSDPSRLLEGTIRKGRHNFEDIIEYNFQSIPEFELCPESPPIEEPLSPTPTYSTTLPQYIPPFLPAFPEIKEDGVVEEENGPAIDKSLKEKAIQSMIPQVKAASAESLPPPLIVKNKKKPVDNPFTHIVPFEESILAAEANISQQPLSLAVEPADLSTKKASTPEKEPPRKKARLPALKGLSNTNGAALKLGEGIVGHDELFRIQTENEAAPGNHMFDRDIGVFEEIVRSVTDPLLLPRLTTPNLLIDVATTGTTSVPATPTTQYTMNDQHSVPSSPQSSASNDITRPNKASMLAALASSKAGLKRLGRPLSPMSLSEFANAKASTGSVDINNMQKTGDSKYIIKKKKMLLQQQLLQQQQQLLLQQQQQQQQQQGQQGQQGQNQQIQLMQPSPSDSQVPQQDTQQNMDEIKEINV